MASAVKEFIKKIHNKKAGVAVVGLGYVGLPLALEFVKHGYKVTGIEIDQDRLKHIREKKSYISDVPTRELRRALHSGKFSASGDFAALKKIDVVIICVPTPLKRKYHPDIRYIVQAVKEISKNIKAGALVILESTTYPGTTEEVILPILEEKGLRHGRDFYLCFSPERIDPGNAHFPVHKIPKIVGGINKDATALAAALYGNVVCKAVPVSSARAAEAAKLLENTFRLINIAMIDELAMMAHKMKIDIWEVIHAASTKPFGFMPFYPGPGVGGHCIPKDPLYLYWKAKHFGFRSRFIKLASDVISYMPEYVVERLAEELSLRGAHLSKAGILVMGVTYKKDIKDLRKSPSIDIINILHKKAGQVHYCDNLIPYLKVNGVNMRSVELDAEKLKGFDCVVIATDHSDFDYGFILKNSRFIFDTRNVYKGREQGKVVRL